MGQLPSAAGAAWAACQLQCGTHVPVWDGCTSHPRRWLQQRAEIGVCGPFLWRFTADGVG